MRDEKPITIFGLSLATVLSIGCLPPKAHLPPPTTGTSSGDVTREMSVSRDAVFPKVLEVLIGMGYQIRSVNQELGQININRTWTELHTGNPFQYSIEVTLLFQKAGPNKTRAHILAQTSAPGLEKHQLLDSAQCQSLLQSIETALTPAN